MRIERLRQEQSLIVQWIHFPLHPDTPADGITLEELFTGRGYDIESMNAQMAQRMEAEGLPYGERKKTFNSRLAQELAAWAESQPGGDQIHLALFKAYFVQGLNIGNIEVLVKTAESIGLSVEAARATLNERSYRAIVDEDWAKSRRYGITGVPTFVAGDQAANGAVPYEQLVTLVQNQKS